MLQMFRKGISSKLGMVIALAFLGLIALAFAAGDVTSSGGFGGIAGGDRVASVGKDRIDTAELERASLMVVDNMRRENPATTTKSFIERGGLDDMLDYLIDRAAVFEFGKKHGLHISDRLVDSEIAKIPGVQGPDGKVDPALYQQIINQRRESDAQFRKGLATELSGRQLMASTRFGVVIPNSVMLRFAGIVTERRKGVIATLPSAAFAPKTAPSEAEIKAWYETNRADYMLPERRVIRYAVFGEDAIRNAPAPTEAEIAARYNANKAKYAPTQKRKLAQMVVPTEAAAKAVLAEVSAGKTLEAAAAAKGLGVAALELVTREEYALQASPAAAEAVFAATKGKLVGPVKAPLGWLLVRVEDAQSNPGKTLAQASGEIRTELAAEKRRAALTDFSAGIEEQFDNGAALGDLAKEMGKTLSTTPALLANGSVFGKQGEKAPAIVERLLTTAFAMEGEGQPQLAEVEPGKTFVVFDVGQILAAAPPPLPEIRSIVAQDVQLSKGGKLAQEAAKKIEAQVAKGVPLEVAMASIGAPLPPIDRVDRSRQEIQALGPNVPQPLQLMFLMAKGKLKLLAAPRNRGWYVITVSDIIPGQVDPKDQRLIGLAQSLQKANSDEYAKQLSAAMRQDVGVERNDNAIAAVRQRLLGGN